MSACRRHTVTVCNSTDLCLCQLCVLGQCLQGGCQCDVQPCCVLRLIVFERFSFVPFDLLEFEPTDLVLDSLQGPDSFLQKQQAAAV